MKLGPEDYSVVRRHPPHEEVSPGVPSILPYERPARELRERYLDHLRECYADERLTHEEMDARVIAVMAARTIRELEELVRDLPRLPHPKPASHWKRLGAMTRLAILLFCMAGAFALGIVPAVLLDSYHAPASIGAPVITCSILAALVWLVISIILIVIDKGIQNL